MSPPVPYVPGGFSALIADRRCAATEDLHQRGGFAVSVTSHPAVRLILARWPGAVIEAVRPLAKLCGWCSDPIGDADKHEECLDNERSWMWAMRCD